MARYIEEGKLISKLDWDNDIKKWTLTDDALKHLPTADVVEVKHEEWKPIVKQDNYFEPPYCDTCKCSACEYKIDVSETVYNYCPHCGAKMDGGKVE